jgi:hypothetical protein
MLRGMKDSDTLSCLLLRMAMQNPRRVCNSTTIELGNGLLRNGPVVPCSLFPAVNGSKLFLVGHGIRVLLRGTKDSRIFKHLLRSMDTHNPRKALQGRVIA